MTSHWGGLSTILVLISSANILTDTSEMMSTVDFLWFSQVDRYDTYNQILLCAGGSRL
jgi:hypothetical protein